MDKPMEKKMLSQKELGLMKRGMHEQLAFLHDVMKYMRQRSCTPSEDKMRKKLMRVCELRRVKLTAQINETNTEIYKLAEAERRAMQK